MMHLTSYLNKKNEALIAVHFMHSAVAKLQYMSESLNHSLNQFIQNINLFRNGTCDLLYERVIGSFTKQFVDSIKKFIYSWI